MRLEPTTEQLKQIEERLPSCVPDSARPAIAYAVAQLFPQIMETAHREYEEYMRRNMRHSPTATVINFADWLAVLETILPEGFKAASVHNEVEA